MTVYAVMNDTKWDELRLAMYGLGVHSPRWRTSEKTAGLLSDWDGDWFYHFRAGGYASIEWLEISIDSAEQDNMVLEALKKVHVPGCRVPSGFKVFGYTAGPVDYIA